MSESEDANRRADVSSSRRLQGFYTAPFAISGMPEGVGYWELERLSPNWLAACAKFLDQNGSSFDAFWAPPLGHIKIKFSGTSGVALVTFHVRERIAASVALGSGRSIAAEHDVLSLFVKSLRRIGLVQAAAPKAADAFEAVLSITERPIMVVVPWPDPMIADQDQELVRELALHLAGAFFAKN